MSALQDLDGQSLQVRADDADVFELSREALDELPFGVITLDRTGLVLRFNREQETLAHRESMRTVGLSFFNDVAPCANVQAFRGRFDAFCCEYDSGVERFAFSFTFRWGRQDVSITMLRKAGHDEINILIRGRSVSSAVPALDLPAGVASERLAPATALPSFFDAKALSAPVVHPLDAAYFAGLRSRVHPDDLVTVTTIVADAQRNCTTYALEYRGPGKNTERRVFAEHGSFKPAPEIGYATVTDVTEQRQIEAQTWRTAHYDRLTGLPNQHLLLLRIADAVREAECNGTIAAVVMANIDRFRDVNDTSGHSIGDEILRSVGLRLGECVRGGDTVARIGGDSFVVLLTDVDTQRSVAEAATRMVSAVAAPFRIGDHSYYIGLRVGISLAPYDGRDSLRLLLAAETAVNSAKGSAANALRFYSNQIAIDAASSLQRQIELRTALEDEEFELLYQPLIDVKRDRVVAAEALVRWNHPTRGVVSPLDFIPLADRTGLIVPLGEWVLRTACRQARAWQDAGLIVRVCVNVSAVQFARPDFVDLVASIVAEIGLEPARLELELTESIMVNGFGEMMETLTRLKALGLRLAIDDFGTGYSSLSYLKYFPVDTLKVDRAFVNDIVSDTFDHAIATAIFALAKNLGLECVVEGVENADQLRTLSEIGSTVIQGFYFCRPSRPQQLAALLAAPAVTAHLFAAVST